MKSRIWILSDSGRVWAYGSGLEELTTTHLGLELSTPTSHSAQRQSHVDICGGIHRTGLTARRSAAVVLRGIAALGSASFGVRPSISSTLREGGDSFHAIHKRVIPCSWFLFLVRLSPSSSLRPLVVALGPMSNSPFTDEEPRFFHL